jgi:hypothetical protein
MEGCGGGRRHRAPGVGVWGSLVAGVRSRWLASAVDLEGGGSFGGRRRVGLVLSSSVVCHQ